MATFLKMANALKKEKGNAAANQGPSPTSSGEDKKSVLGAKLGDLVKKNKAAGMLGEY